MILEEEETAPLLPKAAQAAAAAAVNIYGTEDEEALVASPPPPYSTRPATTSAELEAVASSAWSRFARALIIASIIWAVIAVPFRISFLITYSKLEKQLRDSLARSGYSPSQDGIIERCSTVSSWSGEIPQNAATLRMPIVLEDSFTLPLDSPSLLFFSRGEYSSSAINVVEDESLTEDVLNVTVKAVTYAGNPHIDSAHVCTMDRGNRSASLGLFTPNSTDLHPGHDPLQWIVTVRIPVRDERFILLNTFESNLTHFEHYFGDLGGVVHFGNLTVSAGDGPVLVRTLTADHVQLHNVDGLIQGQFDVKRSISLRTETGTVESEIDLHPRGIRGNYEASMDLHSTHGNVSGMIALSSSSLLPTSFIATGESDTGSVVLEFTGSPCRSTLNLSLSTNGPLAGAALPPMFQGEYLLHTRADPPRIWSRSVSGASRDDHLLAYVKDIVSWLVAEPRPYSTVTGRINSAEDDHPLRHHDRLPPAHSHNGSLNQGSLHWQPRDPQLLESVAWIRGQNVLLIT